MLFSSLTFLLIFLPLCLILYFLLPGIKLKNTLLLIFSLVFYSWGEPIYIILMILSILVTYIFGLLIDRGKNKKLYFILSIVILLLNLLFFKYSNFLIDNINSLFNLKIGNLDLALPIGISFYTFQALSYLIDLYKKKIKVQNNFFYLALYVCLFPQLIAGPIVRYETVEEEINVRTHSIDKFVLGLKRFIIGLSKKVVLSNSVALIADTIFNSYTEYGTILLWVAAICYTLQIYFDFSGYSDMAIGLGKIFGFNFLENFNYPYVATSITDFWRRWHMSLSSFFRDYVYIPLGGSRVSKIINIRNILIVWGLTGLWHGASWNFIIWGLYFAVLLIMEKFLFKSLKIPKFLRHVITMFLVVISWVIFRVEVLSDLGYVLKTMFIFKSDNIILFLCNHASLIINLYMIIPAIIFCVPFKKFEIKNYIIKNIINVCYFVLFILNIVCIMGSSYNPFIYFRF